MYIFLCVRYSIMLNCVLLTNVLENEWSGLIRLKEWTGDESKFSTDFRLGNKIVYVYCCLIIILFVCRKCLIDQYKQSTFYLMHCKGIKKSMIEFSFIISKSEVNS